MYIIDMSGFKGRPPVGGYGEETKRIGSVRLPMKVYLWIQKQTSHVNTWLKDVAIYKYTKNKDKKL